MGLIYVYLAAWVVGGVLLGGRILLNTRDAAGADVIAEGEPLPTRRGARLTGLAAATLIGFGLFGLVAEGLGLADGAWTSAFAAGGSLLLMASSYLLRSRRELPAQPPAPPMDAPNHHG